MYNSDDKRIITNLKHVDNINKKSIVLTFDDGPSKHLEDILTILSIERIPAMFFWQGRLFHHKRPWRRVVEDGHVIGLHGNSHRNLINLTYEEQKKEIVTSKQKIELVTNQKIQFFRPPFGRYNENTLKIASNLQLDIVMWDITSFDWLLNTEPAGIVRNVVSHVQDGSIILLHELKQTVEILPTLIKDLREKGFAFTTL